MFMNSFSKQVMELGLSTVMMIMGTDLFFMKNAPWKYFNNYSATDKVRKQESFDTDQLDKFFKEFEEKHPGVVQGHQYK